MPLSQRGPGDGPRKQRVGGDAFRPTLDDTVESHGFTARIHPDLAAVATGVHLSIGLSLLDRRREYEIAARYDCPRARRLMCKLTNSEADEELLERLRDESPLTKQQVIDVALHQARKSPLAPLPGADVPAPPAADADPPRAAVEASGEANETVAVSELPFFVSDDPDRHPDFDITTPFDAELIFLRASAARLREHHERIVSVLADPVTNEEERLLIEQTRALLEDSLRARAGPASA